MKARRADTLLLDEPRRSVRATKGQHTKSHDILDQTPEGKTKSSKKSSKKTKNVEEEDESDEEIIRCVCGVTESKEDDEDAWIMCDKCTVWQHNVCVGVSPFDGDIGEDYVYMCEQCSPSAHKPLLEARKQGHNLWEDRQREFEQKKKDEAEEEAAQKKKGKKGKGKRASEVRLETPKATNGKAKSPIPVAEVKKEQQEGTPKAGSGKKNHRDESQDADLVKVSERRYS